MDIYLLNLSPHNEDFILDGYAVDEAGIKQLAFNYYVEYYYPRDPSQFKAKVDFDKKEVECDCGDDGSITFCISKIPLVVIL